MKIPIEMKPVLIAALFLAITTNFGAGLPNESLSPTSENPTVLRLKSIACQPDDEPDLEIDDIKSTTTPTFEQLRIIDSSENNSVQESDKKKVSFADTQTVRVIPSDPSGIFWIKKKELISNFIEKTELYDEWSKEFYLLDMLCGFIEKCHTVYAHIFRFIVKLDGYNLFLCQTDVKVDDETIIEFPDSKVFANLEKDKAYFKSQFINLLHSLQPTYEINQHLLELMNTMDNNTEINSNRLEDINAEGLAAYDFIERLTKLMDRCQLKKYREHLSSIRKRTNSLEFRKITLDAANESLNKSLEILTPLSETITKNLRKANRLDFQKLHEATLKFYGLVNEALNSPQ